MADEKSKSAEVKQAVVNEKAPRKVTKVRIPNFRGGYGDAFFNDDGIAENVSPEMLERLRHEFPGLLEEL